MALGSVLVAVLTAEVPHTTGLSRAFSLLVWLSVRPGTDARTSIRDYYGLAGMRKLKMASIHYSRCTIMNLIRLNHVK